MMVLVSVSDPPVFVAVNATSYVPLTENEYGLGDGFVVVCAPVPSSKSQEYVNAPIPVLVFTNVTSNGISPDDLLIVKLATGTVTDATVTYPVLVCVALPPAFVAVNDTVYVPGVLYVFVGFCEVLVVLSPKFHNHVVTGYNGLLVVPSVNAIDVIVAYPVLGVAIKFGDGNGIATTSIQFVLVVVRVPPPPVPVNDTVYIQSVEYVFDGFGELLVVPSPKSHV